MAIVTDKYRGTGEYFLVFNELVFAAKHRGTATYQELADLVGLPIVGAHMGTEIGHVLGEISEDQHKLGRPMLSAVAVGVSGMPGPGFFACAKSLGKFNGELQDEQRRFWETELKAVYQLWQRKFS
jgi:hypothetical protein